MYSLRIIARTGTPFSLLGRLTLKTTLKTELTRDDFPTPVYIILSISAKEYIG